MFAALGGILLGALTALYRNRLPDLVIMFLVILGISVPSFVVAAVSQLTLVDINAYLGFPLLPVAGWGTLRPHDHPVDGPGARHHGLSHEAHALVDARDHHL